MKETLDRQMAKDPAPQVTGFSQVSAEFTEWTEEKVFPEGVGGVARALCHPLESF